MKLFSTLLSCIAVAALTGCNRDTASSNLSGTQAEVNLTAVNLQAEVAKAKAGNKLLLLEFGSSDSCPPCIEFEKKVFSTAEFQMYEKSNVNFVRLDFPIRTKLPASVEATNIALSRQFQAFAFPTFVALDHEGNEFWRMPGKDDPEPTLDTKLFKPAEFIALLESLKAKLK